MPPRSAILDLPEDIKAELDRRLLANSFQDYRGLAAWLAENGCYISKSALHEYGQDFQARLGALKLATEQVRAVVQTLPDEEGAFNEAVMRLAQERLFYYLVDANLDPRDPKQTAAFTKAVHAIADLGRASVNQKQWAGKVQKELDTRLASLEAKAKGGDGGLDLETLRRVREEIYGIV
jgi:hypothetical protein